MHRQRLLFQLGLALAVIGTPLFFYGLFTQPRPGTPEAKNFLLWLPLLAGGAMALGGAGLALTKWFVVRELAKFQNNVDVLARWQVGPGELAAFHRADRARAALTPSLRNWLSLPASTSAAGLPIALTTDALLIGGEFHPLGMRNTSAVGMPCEVEIIEGEPAMLEITMGKTAFADPTQTRAFTPELRRPFWVMRLPIAASARANAEAARDAIDAAIWTVNRDWARLTYAAHFAIADRDAAGRDTALAAMPATPEPAPHDQSPEAQAFHAIANVFGIDAAKAPTKDSPAYRKAQAQFFGGVGGLALLFGANTVLRFDSQFDQAMAVVWAVLFFIAAWFTVRGGWGYLVRRGN